MNFNKGDHVKAAVQYGKFAGKVGTVTQVYTDGETFAVKLDDGEEYAFFLSELEHVDAKREALIELAETLDKARLQANAIDEYTIAAQGGVYGYIVLALTDTLEAIFDGQVDDENLFANLTYNAILDGNTVREALAVVVK